MQKLADKNHYIQTDRGRGSRREEQVRLFSRAGDTQLPVAAANQTLRLKRRETNQPSVSTGARTHVFIVDGQSGGILRVPVPEEDLLSLALQGPLAFTKLRPRLVHDQANASSGGEVLL